MRPRANAPAQRPAPSADMMRGASLVSLLALAALATAASLRRGADEGAGGLVLSAADSASAITQTVITTYIDNIGA